MIDKAKKYLKEVKELNKQGRAILNEMKKTRNPQKLEALKKELRLVFVTMFFVSFLYKLEHKLPRRANIGAVVNF